MPGFRILGGEMGPAPLAEVRRTHRWVFQALGELTRREILLVLKSASRPSFQFEEPAMHHNQEQIYFAGKHTWEPVSLSWYDVEQDPDVSDAMYQWLKACIDLTRMTVNPPQSYKSKIAMLEMLDGLGNQTELWNMYQGWPQAVNWNGLDYSSSELQLIEVKYRYDRAIKVSQGTTQSITGGSLV